MFSTPIRFTLIIISAAWGTYRLMSGYLDGVVFLFVAALVMFGYFRYGTVWAAWQALRKEKSDQAKKLLDRIKYPNMLDRQNRAFYYFIKGSLAMEDQDLALGEKSFRCIPKI